jgi:hypothetical protein
LSTGGVFNMSEQDPISHEICDLKMDALEKRMNKQDRLLYAILSTASASFVALIVKLFHLGA